MQNQVSHVLMISKQVKKITATSFNFN